MNFGPMPIGAARRTEKFTIENRGEHDFKFVITKYQRDVAPQKLNVKYVVDPRPDCTIPFSR